jgi:uncharacterized protein
MSSPFPDLLDPWRAVDKCLVYAGILPLSNMSRLRGLLLDATGDVTFRLAFQRDEGRRAILHCETATTLKLRCQRCLDGLDHRIVTDTSLALVSGAAEERLLPESYDPLPVSSGPIRLADLVEDELLLALPQIPMHEPDVCGAVVGGQGASQGPVDRDRPFAVLAGLGREH